MSKLISTIALMTAAGLAWGIAQMGPSRAQNLPAAERPLKPEKNPPGDIPDNQVFIQYNSPRGFSLKVPEGWARRDLPEGAAFADKYGQITVSQTDAISAL